MTTGVEVIPWIMKYLWLPIIGVIGWLAKGYFNKLEERLKIAEDAERALEAKVNLLELDITKNYYDKDELRISVVDPLLKDIRETHSELKLLAGMLNEIHQDMAILKYKILGSKSDKS